MPLQHPPEIAELLKSTVVRLSHSVILPLQVIVYIVIVCVLLNQTVSLCFVRMKTDYVIKWFQQEFVSYCLHEGSRH